MSERAAFVAVIHLLFGYSLAFSNERIDISITVQRGTCTTAAGCVLDIVLSNRSPKAIRFPHAELPWATQDSILLVAVPTSRHGEVLKQPHWIDDPVRKVIVLRSDEQIRGQIVISHRFPDLIKTLEVEDVLLAWTYRLRTQSGHVSNRMSGHLLLPVFRK